MTEACDMIAAMRRLTEEYAKNGRGEAPSPWMGVGVHCVLCKVGTFPHLHRGEWIEVRR
jgi:hypothetical protein